MNIYAQENCNDYKSTQELELSDSSDSTGYINIDWAESFAVDVNGPQAGEGCTFNYYGNENCQTGLGSIEVVGNSGCKDPSLRRISIGVTCQLLHRMNLSVCREKAYFSCDCDTSGELRKEISQIESVAEQKNTRAPLSKAQYNGSIQEIPAETPRTTPGGYQLFDYQFPDTAAKSKGILIRELLDQR
ncbi:hypothetical protein BDR22DRAFT_822390 [Usnea florida]